MKTIKVEPLRTEIRPMLVEFESSDRSGTEMVRIEVYPDSPRGRELCAMRLKFGLSLRGGANALEIGVVEYSEIELGARVPEDWEGAFDSLTAVGEEGGR